MTQRRAGQAGYGPAQTQQLGGAVVAVAGSAGRGGGGGGVVDRRGRDVVAVRACVGCLPFASDPTQPRTILARAGLAVWAD
jgi:hypothetical protein